MNPKTGLATALVAAVVAAIVSAATLVIVWRAAPGVVDVPRSATEAPSAAIEEKQIRHGTNWDFPVKKRKQK